MHKNAKLTKWQTNRLNLTSKQNVFSSKSDFLTRNKITLAPWLSGVGIIQHIAGDAVSLKLNTGRIYDVKTFVER